MDDTLIEALALLKSYRPKDEEEPPTQDGGCNPTVDFRGEKRSRETHESKTDPDAQSGSGGMLMAGLRGVGMPGTGQIGQNWLISSQRAGIALPRPPFMTRMGGLVGLFSTAC